MLTMALGTDYRKALVDKYQLPTGWMANWIPGTDVAVGMVGRFDGGSFVRHGWLNDPSRGISWEKDPYPGTPDGPWDFQTKDSVSIENRLNGETDPAWAFIGAAKAGVRLSFRKGGGIIVATSGSHEEHIADQKALREQLLAAHLDGRRMELRDVIITAVRVATAGFVLISHDSGGEVLATADIAAGGFTPLTQLAGKIHIQSQSSMASAESYPHGFVIAFQGIELLPRRWRWLPRRWRFGHVTTAPLRGPEEDDIFLELPEL
jgi:hypothetical protein